MTGAERVRRFVVSLAVWWLLLALVLWLLGKAFDQPASAAQCATSSAFLVALGEIGDCVRRRWRTRKDS
ncbi:hypothetical protein [Streptomyces sp. NPDC002547]